MPSKLIPPFFNIIPVKDKKAQVAWGEFIDRAQTIEEKAEFSKAETLGIMTGPVSRILVLDDDGGLDENLFPVPKTWTVRTPRGGRHFYFKWTPALDGKVTTLTDIFNKKVETDPGVDVRGHGGYVVFYGFERPYMSLPLACPPQWLIDLLPNKEGAVAEKAAIPDLFDGMKEGNRNHSFARVAGSLRRRGYNVDEMFAFLAPKARELEYPEKDLLLLCRSIGRYAPQIQPDHGQAASIDSFLADIETVDWLVPGMIAKKSIAFVAGLPETGKTWMLIDLAIECAKGGGLWLNKFPVKGAKVLFVDQERFKGETQRRFKAVISAKDNAGGSISQTLFIRCGTSTRINLQNSFDTFRKELAEIRPELVIVDSFATFHTCEENNRQSIQAVLEKIKELRNEFGCTFIFVHHENKAAFSKDDSGEPSIAQMAGNVAIPAVAETVFTVRKQDSESSMVYMTKSTLASCQAPFLVKVQDMDVEKTKIKVEAY